LRTALVPSRRRHTVAVAGLTAALTLLPAAPALAHGGGAEDVPVAGASTFPAGVAIAAVAGAMILGAVGLLLLSRRKRDVPARPGGLMAAGSAPRPPIGPRPVAHAAPVAAPSGPIPAPAPARVEAAAVAEARPGAAQAPSSADASAGASAQRSCSNCGNAQEFPGRFCIACGTRFGH
jgi:hypothetical protein